jgi:hypothetical protein
MLRAFLGGLAMCLVPGLAAAETLRCEMQGDAGALSVEFSYDPAQFAPAQDLAEPPRRAVAEVWIGARRLVAEAISMVGGFRGFHSDMPPDLPVMMIVGPEGRATLTQGARDLQGRCEAIR